MQLSEKHFWSLSLAALGFAALAIAAMTLDWQVQHRFVAVMYDDIHDRLKLYNSINDWRQFFFYLTSPHNEHIILTTRFLIAIDEFLFRGKTTFIVVATNILQIVMASGVFFLFKRWAGREWTVFGSVMAFGTLLMMFINSAFLYTLIVPFQVQHAIMGGLCLTAAALVATVLRGDHDKLGCLLPYLIGLAIVGTFTLGNAPVILLSAAATAIVLRRSVWTCVILAGLAVAHTCIMLAITPSAGSRSTDLIGILHFLLIYLGGPFLRFDSWPAPFAAYPAHPLMALGFGSAILSIGVLFAGVRFFKPGFGGPLAAFGLMLLIAVVITGMAAGVSRLHFGILEAGNKKYASFAVLAWVAAIAILCGTFNEKFERYRDASLAPLVFSALIILPLSFFSYERETRIWQKAVDWNWEAATAVLAHVGEKGLMRGLYTEDAGLKAYLQYNEARRRGLFARFHFRPGEQAENVLAGRHEAPCRGEVEAVTPVAPSDLTTVSTADGVPLSTSGWTWMLEDYAPPGNVIAVDSMGRIAGVARLTRASSRAELWLGQKFNDNLGWFGFARNVTSEPLTFIAISRSGRSFCRLGAVGQVK